MQMYVDYAIPTAADARSLRKRKLPAPPPAPAINCFDANGAYMAVSGAPPALKLVKRSQGWCVRNSRSELFVVVNKQFGVQNNRGLKAASDINKGTIIAHYGGVSHHAMGYVSEAVAANFGFEGFSDKAMLVSYTTHDEYEATGKFDSRDHLYGLEKTDMSLEALESVCGAINEAAVAENAADGYLPVATLPSLMLAMINEAKPPLTNNCVFQGAEQLLTATTDPVPEDHWIWKHPDRIYLIAATNIKKGEPLLVSYGGSHATIEMPAAGTNSI